MSLLLSDPRLTDRERVCARNWLQAAIDDDDPDTAAFWQAEGLKARTLRLLDGHEPAPEPAYVPLPRRKKAAACDLCKSPTCKNSACLL
jgi:hypothetical protein